MPINKKGENRFWNPLCVGLGNSLNVCMAVKAVFCCWCEFTGACTVVIVIWSAKLLFDLESRIATTSNDVTERCQSPECPWRGHCPDRYDPDNLQHPCPPSAAGRGRRRPRRAKGLQTRYAHNHTFFSSFFSMIGVSCSLYLDRRRYLVNFPCETCNALQYEICRLKNMWKRAYLCARKAGQVGTPSTPSTRTAVTWNTSTMFWKGKELEIHID